MKALDKRAIRMDDLDTGDESSRSIKEFSISPAKSVALFVDPNRTPCITQAGRMKSRKVTSGYGNSGRFTALLNCAAYTAASNKGKNSGGAQACGWRIIPRMLR